MTASEEAAGPTVGARRPRGGGAATCSAAEAGLYFRPEGIVTSCCAGWHELGRVTGPHRRSLREIWDGGAADTLRRALAANDFGLGCFECGRYTAEGRRAESLIATFDRYRRPEPRRHPAIMDFALSNRCNLQCVQCNGSFSSSIRSDREHREPLAAAYDDRFFDELDEFLPHLERAQFKGGEPFLARENRRIWDRLLAGGSRPEICVTTNGTIWNDHVERYTRELGFDVVVSVDAIEPEVLARIRVGVDPDRLWTNVDRFRAATAANGRTVTLCFCLMSLSWHQLGAFLARTDELGVIPEVIWVDGPGEVNLLTMAPAELAAALAQLENEDARRGDLSDRARAIWTDALDRVRQQVETGGSPGVPVQLGRHLGGAANARDQLADAIARLAASHGGDLLTVHYVNDVITSIEPAAWSGWLRPDTWIGHGLGETMMLVAGGSTMRSSVESTEGGSHQIELELDTPDGARRLRGIHVPALDGGASSHLVLADASNDGR